MKASFEKKDVILSAAKIKGFKPYVPMFHKHMELVYVLKGKLNVCIDGQETELNEGEISIAFPYTIHSYERADDLEAFIVLFSPEAVELFHNDVFHNKPVYPYVKNNNRIHNLIECLVEYARHDEKMAQVYLNTVMGEILKSLKLVKTENTDVNSAQQVLIYCSEHYREDMSIKNVASALYLSESYVTKIFSGKLGCSFREYINTLRINEAKKLLRNTVMKIVEIMYACGFKNQSSFNRVFYEETGFTPKEYRRSIEVK